MAPDEVTRNGILRTVIVVWLVAMIVSFVYEIVEGPLDVDPPANPELPS